MRYFNSVLLKAPFVFVFAFGCVDCFCQKIAVVGLGYVGLITSSIFASFGNEVICFDIDPKKIEQLKIGVAPFFEPGFDQFLFQTFAYPIQYSNDIKSISHCSLCFICVGTPSGAEGKCDLSMVYSAIDQALAQSPGPKIICIKSTVPPGSIRKIRSYLDVNHKEGIELIYNPEFMRQGAALKDIFNGNPLVVGGDSTSALEQIIELYEPLFKASSSVELIKTNFETAELIKYAWNGFSALRITYINELSCLCREFSADVQTLIKGISLSEKLLPTKDIKPGPGYGGSCLPKDTRALAYVLKDNAIYPSLIHQTIDSNEHHILDQIELIIDSLGACPLGKVVSILGLAFKADTDDIRESCSIRIIEELIKHNITIRSYDRWAVNNMKAIFPELQFFDSAYQSIENADCVLVLTDSDEIKQMELSRMALLVKQKILIDPRNVFDPKEAKANDFKILNSGRI